jgi:hypothetical protein
VQHKAAPCPLDLVNRAFHAPAPTMLWLSDFTYVSTWSGFVYVAFVIDAYARPHRRLAGEQDSACELRARCSGAGPPRTAPRSSRKPSASFGPRIAIRQHSVSRAPWPRRVSSPPSAASETPTTMHSQRRSTASTRLRSSIGVGRGGASKRSSSRR